MRSQDKECLLKTNRVDIDTNGRTIMVNGFESIIGIYKSKERALEILDEIQRTITRNQSLISLMHNFTDLKGNEEGVAQIFKDMIYEMPEE